MTIEVNGGNIMSGQALRDLEGLRARLKVPSLAVGTIIDGRVADLGAAGMADLAAGRAATVDTAYLWFSITKLFTATAVVQLWERGLVDLDAPISELLAGDLPLAMTSRRPITCRTLLTHSSGIANPLPLRWIHLADEPGPRLKEMTLRLLHDNRRLRFEPGSRVAYSNLGYLVLGMVIEAASGLDYAAYVKKRILAPLKSSRSGFTFPADDDAAVAYVRAFSPMGIAGRLMIPHRFFGPATHGSLSLRRYLVDGAPYGGLVGPLSDLTAFVAAHAAGGCALLGHAAASEMVTPQSGSGGALLTTRHPTIDKPVAIGLGWHLSGEGSTRFGLHMGGGAGFWNQARVYPETGEGLAILGNTTSFDIASAIQAIRVFVEA